MEKEIKKLRDFFIVLLNKTLPEIETEFRQANTLTFANHKPIILAQIDLIIKQLQEYLTKNSPPKKISFMIKAEINRWLNFREVIKTTTKNEFKKRRQDIIVYLHQIDLESRVSNKNLLKLAA